MINIIEPLLKEGREGWDENIKMLLFKDNENIFDNINFENEVIYRNPLLNLYYRGEKSYKQLLNILYANWEGGKEISLDSNEKMIYIPEYGWINKKLNFLDKQVITPYYLVEDHKIELLPYKFDLLHNCFGNYDYDISEISKKNINYLKKSYQLIKKNLPEYFLLIEKYCPRCIIFDTSPLNTNSFAYKGALGIAFYNAYQKKYDEVFFVDDIAHQTGHNLMYTMLLDKELFFNIDDENISIQNLAFPHKIENNRSVEIWFHALYTYYASFICLDACLDNNDFSKIQRIEALGRILLYIHRCYYDLQLYYTSIPGSDIFKKIPKNYNFIETTNKNIFSPTGIEIFHEIKYKWIEIFNKYYLELVNFNLDGQLYNFDLSIFIKNNPKCIELL